MKIWLHFSRQTEPQGLPWAVKTGFREAPCGVASHVRFEVPVESEEHEIAINDVRYFLVAEGELVWDGTVAVIKKIP